ncbi:hypothetical protein Cfor_03462 [Coptotermes formosanus]|uniref:tRNA/rRNA methyltransferase SpoU type domain-containing protein n=1 Tax=Coptotermes formosanus TaxID=36987 RepID=A0A6L2PUT2_COPFO|nr:hypothetical protein Cfor_03462 [Coptotermes formosanus]
MACLLRLVRRSLPKAFGVTNKLNDMKLPMKQHVRHHPRWAHRRPLRIIYPEDLNKEEVNYAEKLKVERESIPFPAKDQEDVFENADITFKDKETIISNARSVNTSATNVKYNIKHTVTESKLHNAWIQENYKTKISLPNAETTQNSNLQSKSKKVRKLEAKQERKAHRIKESAARAGVPIYKKLPDDDSTLSSAMLIAKSKNKKKKRSLIVLEGKRLIKDAIAAGYVPQKVFFSRVKDAADLNLPDEGVELYKTSYKSISLWSDLTTSPGVLGILKTPSVDHKKPGKDALPLTIICDNIRDPGNLGAILRGAAGVGCQKVILMKGCVDLWEPKVIRSGAGAHFRTSVVSDVEWDELDTHVDGDASVFLADNLIGGETEGLSFSAFRLAHDRYGVRLNVPLSNNVESLNSGTALGIIVFEMKRQFLRKLQHKSGEDISEEIERINVPNV